MAHFAELNGSNIVQRVIVIDNNDILDASGNESEALGIAICQKHCGATTVWKQCSYNGSMRKTYPGPGSVYDAANDLFRTPQPVDPDGDTCNSWTLNTSTGAWDPPIAQPTDKAYYWDESVYQADSGSPKTLGWIAFT
tara:strand:+ start:80 stop:493 length:414 start_codon:yes stop_codon:yes gene_type:complete